MTLLHLLRVWRIRQLSLGQPGFHFQIIVIDPRFVSSYTFLRKSGSLVVVWIKSLAAAAACSFCSGSRSHRTNFPPLHVKTLRQNLGHSSFWNPQISFYFSHCQLPIFVDCSPYMFNTLRCSTCCRPSRMWITFNRFLTIFEAFVPQFYLHFTHYIIHKSLLSPLNSFMEECSSLTQNFLFNFNFLLLFNYSCVAFLPIPPPHPSQTPVPPPLPPSPLILSMCTL